MKSITMLLILGLTLAGCSRSDSDKTKTQAQSEYYTCPMHPSVISDRPGACPVCGMALVKKSAVAPAVQQDVNTLGKISLSPTQRVLANVATQSVRRTTVHKEISLVGIVDVAESHQATVSARFRGRIEQLHVNYTGEKVQKGQPLFELYSPDLVTAQQEFILALQGNQTLGSLRERLVQHFGMTEEQISELEQAKQVRNTVQFNSPISGTVINKQVQQGQYVDEGTVLYQLADLSKVWIYLDVYERDLRFISVGQIVHIVNESYPDEEFSGRVTFIDPVMNPETRTVRVRTEFSNALGKLKPKMFVKATVSLPIAKALVVPSSAVLFTGKRSVVWVETATNVFEPRDVVVGTETDQSYEILSGLKEGDIAATSGGFLIDSESALRQPDDANPHAGHAPAPQEAAEDHSAHGQMNSASARDIRVVVKGEYSPNILRATVGERLRIHFDRQEDTQCTNEVVFEELNIRRKLPAFKTTTIEITPKESGEIHFSCGQGMVHGKLIVE